MQNLIMQTSPRIFVRLPHIWCQNTQESMELNNYQILKVVKRIGDTRQST